MREPVNKLTDDPVVLRIMDQLQLQNLTEKSLLDFLGASNSLFNAWKYRNVKSYVKYIDRIAEYLGVEKEYLLEGTDGYVNTDTLTATEIKIVGLFRDMGNRQQATFIGIGEMLVESTNLERMTEK